MGTILMILETALIYVREDLIRNYSSGELEHFYIDYMISSPSTNVFIKRAKLGLS